MTDYVVMKESFQLADDIKINIKFDSNMWYQKIWEIRRQVGERKTPTVVDQRIVAEYANGELDKLHTSFNIINPHKMGKEFFVGIDVSPGAKMYFEIEYVRNEKGFIVDRIWKGAQTLYDAQAKIGSRDIVPTINSPLNLAWELEKVFGNYVMPIGLVTDIPEELVSIKIKNKVKE